MKVLIVDEDLTSYDLAMQSPLIDDCDIYCSENIQEILSYLKQNETDIVILDIDRDHSQGLVYLQEIKKSDSLQEVILSGKSIPSEKVMEFLNSGATDFLDKPLQANTLHNIFIKIRDKKNLRQETFRLEKRLEKKYYYQGIVGKSPYMLEIFSLIEKIAKYFTSVLITGETGTGKEMIASAVHAISSSRPKKLVICDCVSIPDNLFESELFGYTRGAFTGADRTRKGLFEEAHNGIIFLDEIGEIPLPIQAKLLRVLEHHQYRPLGSNEIKKIDVKVIAATNRNLKDAVKNGSFREDLYHRLNKVEIHLPPLREKPEDIPLLVRYFLDVFNKRFSKNIKGISRQVQKLFIKYNWSGNIRELENVLERAVMLSSREFIDLEDLPKDLQTTFSSAKKIPFINKENLSTLEDLEKDYIIYLLEATGGNMRKTAKILDISRTTLYNKLAKYSISRHH